jgi:hypothetical protein
MTSVQELFCSDLLNAFSNGARICKPFKEPRNRLDSQPGGIGRRNRFLGIDSWAPKKVYKFGLCIYLRGKYSTERGPLLLLFVPNFLIKFERAFFYPYSRYMFANILEGREGGVGGGGARLDPNYIIAEEALVFFPLLSMAS